MTDRLALVGMILGLLGIGLSVVYAVSGVAAGALALTFGLLARRRTATLSPGRGQAIAAVVTGIVAILAGMVNSTLAVVFEPR
jgi:hypothetical protein